MDNDVFESIKSMSKEDAGVFLRHNGCNCCQAVLIAYMKELGMDAELLHRLGAGFGAGMGTGDGDCGALIGAVMVDDIIGSRRNSAASRKLRAGFCERCGAVRCSDLKGITSGKMICSCDDCIRNAIREIENNRT